MIVKYLYYVLLIFVFPLLLYSELPTQLMDISLGQSYKELKQKIQLKRIRTKNWITKTYEFISSEENSLKIIVSFFKSKVYMITISYSEHLFDETDWETLYNTAISSYGLPKKVYIENLGNTTKENYFWEEEKVRLSYQRITTNDKFKCLIINLIDRKTEHEILTLSPFKKIYYVVIGLF